MDVFQEHVNLMSFLKLNYLMMSSLI